MASKATVKRRIERMRYALSLLERGLEGRPQRVGSTDADSVVKLLANVGVELVSRRALHRRGYRLKRTAHPLLNRYYTAPISRYVELFDLNSQCAPLAKGVPE